MELDHKINSSINLNHRNRYRSLLVSPYDNNHDGSIPCDINEKQNLLFFFIKFVFPRCRYDSFDLNFFSVRPLFQTRNLDENSDEMFRSKFRNIADSSLIDISSINERSKEHDIHHSSLFRYNRNQNRIVLHRSCLPSASDDSLDGEIVYKTKQKIEKVFHRTNFKKILDEIQDNLRPIVEQLRGHVERRRALTDEERLKCLTSCAELLLEILFDDPSMVKKSIYQLDRLRHYLNRKEESHIGTQTDLELDFHKLQLGQ